MLRHGLFRLLATGAATVLAMPAAETAAAAEPSWIVQIGTRSEDSANGVATSPNGIFAVGTTLGPLGGEMHGSYDAFLVQFDDEGVRTGQRQPGTGTSDFGGGVTTDPDGNVFVTGATRGALAGLNAGGYDAFVIKFDPQLRYGWRRQIGTSRNDFIADAATDAAGAIYLVGQTHGRIGPAAHGGMDAFVMKLDRDGRTVWRRQPGTPGEDEATGVAIDVGGNVYVSGVTDGSLGGANKGSGDAFLIKYDTDGRQLWKRQPGTRVWDVAMKIAVAPSGNVYVVGSTEGSLAGRNAGHSDAFVIAFDADGRHRWKRQFGTDGPENASGVATAGDNAVYVVGFTVGSFATTSAGSADAFVVRFDRDGREIWRSQVGSSDSDNASRVATDADGNVYVVGYTYGSLGGPARNGDGFLMKYEADAAR